MSAKSKIEKVSWTRFWTSFEIYIPRTARWRSEYNPASDERRLMRKGVAEEYIKKVRLAFEQNYKEPLKQFHRFVNFFIRDTQIILVATNSNNSSEAFHKLFRKLHYSSFPQAKCIFQQIFLIQKFNEKGMGRSYIARYRGTGSIDNIKGTMFARTLSYNDRRAVYKSLPKFKFGGKTILTLLKSGSGRNIHKFIQLDREGGEIQIKISMDSQKEYNLAKFKLSEYFLTLVDTPEYRKNLKEFLKFLKNGESDHFKLIGIVFLDQDHKVSVFPQNNRLENIIRYTPLKEKFSRRRVDFLDKIVDIRITNKEIDTRSEIFIHFHTFYTDGVIGSILLNLQDKRLNSSERDKFHKDFKSDFGLPLDSFIRFDNVSNSDIYKTFLKNVVRKNKQVKLRSPSALEIYRILSSNGLISYEFDSKEQAAYCFNPNCRLKFKLKWNKKSCVNCHERLFRGRTVVVKKINENKVTDLIYKVSSELGFTVDKFERKLLGRKIYVNEIRKDEKSLCVIPITKDLNENELEVIRFRYPNLLLATSKDNSDHISAKHIKVVELYLLIYKLMNKSSSKRTINSFLREVNRDIVRKNRNLSDESSSRFNNDNYYIQKNKEAKNLGAELFEADCSVLLSYIFGNTIWLGARTRGKPFPDGISALPLTEKANGCFLWDTKFSETGRVVLGKDGKNDNYLKQGRKNPTIKDNGGLKGFVFVSNKTAPNNFLKKFRKLIGRRRLKVTYLSSDQIFKLYRHYKDFENDINNNRRVQEVFVDSMRGLFFSTAGNNKAFVVKDGFLEELLDKNKAKYQKLALSRVRT